MPPALKNNAAAGYQGPVKIELLKDAGLLKKVTLSVKETEKKKVTGKMNLPSVPTQILLCQCHSTKKDAKQF